MTRATFEAIKARYKSLLIVEDDAYEAICFVHDLLTAELEHTEKTFPEATSCIRKLEHAAYEVFSIGNMVDFEEFDEEVK